MFDFQRDIQPILTRHCADCHDYRTILRGIAATKTLIDPFETDAKYWESFWYEPSPIVD